MPATATKQRIIDAIKTRMALINGTGGYYTTIGTKITEWKTNPFGPNRVDGLDIREGIEEEEVWAEDESLTFHRLPIEFRGIFKSPPSIETARNGILDIQKAISVDEFWTVGADRLAQKTLPVSNQIEVDQDESKIVGIRVDVIVEYLTEKFKES